MNIEDCRHFCLSLKGATEDYPFDDKTLVFKVMNKMFALTDADTFEGINVKCNPEKAIELREQYHAVKEGYHMNKKHWNTILVNDDMPDHEVKQWIIHSYELVVAKLNKAEKEALNEL
jgi:predicted DNA-binding protein (MmcQ/YjbR family)